MIISEIRKKNISLSGHNYHFWRTYSPKVKRFLKMKELHFIQKALAERMNYTLQYVSKILKGKENLSLDTMTRLEEALE